MKRLVSFALSLTIALGLFAAAPVQAATGMVASSSFSKNEKRAISISATETISPGEVMKLSVSVSGYRDPVITYVVKKPGKSKYSYLKKQTDRTSLSYRIRTEGEYAFRAIVTERDGSNRKVSATAVCMVEEAVVIPANASALFWSPRDEAPALPQALYSARDGMNAINRTVLALGDTVSFPAYKLKHFFNQIGSAGELHNAFLKGGSISYSARYDPKIGDGIITIHLDYDSAGQLVRKYYYGTETDGSKATAALEKWIKDRLEELMVPDMTDEEKVRAIHDDLVANFEYDTYTNSSKKATDYAEESFTAYGMVKNGYGVCEAYAELFCLMSTYAGVPCYPVTGYYGGGKHMWNKVKIDGKWYNLDCTTDDPIPDSPGRVLHTYYLKSDREFASFGYTWETGLWPAA
ncbi:MAG: transglutaminase domain-containing protein [Christensenellales bacterium]|jgi:hypothetical protein